jgi:hypothetical protein
MYLIFGTFFVEGKTLRLTDDENPVVLTVWRTDTDLEKVSEMERMSILY